MSLHVWSQPGLDIVGHGVICTQIQIFWRRGWWKGDTNCIHNPTTISERLLMFLFESVTLLFNLTSRAGDSKLHHSDHWLSLSECTICGDYTEIAFTESGYKSKFGFFLTWQALLRHNIQTLILSCTWVIDRFFRNEIPWERFWWLQRDSTP